jgi:hypothetical protein
VCGRRGVEVAGGELAGAAEADDRGDVLGAGAQAPLVPGAAREGGEGGAASDVEGADALGRVELVAGEREEVDAELADVTGTLPIDWAASVWTRAPAACARRASSAIGWSDAGLVVGVDHGEQRGVGEGGAGFVEAEHAVARRGRGG